MTFERPPSKEEVRDFLAAFDETTPNSAHWTYSDIAMLVRAYRYQEDVIKGLHDDLRDAGRELRELTREHELAVREADYERGGW